ncbi:hypothetical protein FSARC_9653 [Fusarium sarcochroum]|uniref:Phenazine biosynthesis protein n=1 Tax=Fusarium sarcochroum TaxID=1208366 RepID=A0A8H4TQZ8_9HYPO|nr:hypothetical protein FSARC_9653 [Fusarium sarcochroum]
MCSLNGNHQQHLESLSYPQGTEVHNLTPNPSYSSLRMTMQYLEFAVIDALTKTPFTGNPTPVLIIDHAKPWPDTVKLQEIAREMNHLETMFARLSISEKVTTYDVRCFTPTEEIGFCGHGLFAVALMLRKHCDGQIFLKASDGRVAKAQLLQGDDANAEILLGAPAGIELLIPPLPVSGSLNENNELRTAFAKSLVIEPNQIEELATNAFNDVIIQVKHDVDFSYANPGIDAMGLHNASPSGTRAQIVTSRGDRLGVDYLKRVFWEGSEDHSTGSTHCVLIPYWSEKLGKSRMSCKQLSERTGEVEVKAETDGSGYVSLLGMGVKVLEGKIALLS